MTTELLRPLLCGFVYTPVKQKTKSQNQLDFTYKDQMGSVLFINSLFKFILTC